MQDFESNSIALYNQQIIQILCSDTLELEIELEQNSVGISLNKISQSYFMFSVNHRLKYYLNHQQMITIIQFGFDWSENFEFEYLLNF
jgi:hypothetical protein